MTMWTAVPNVYLKNYDRKQLSAEHIKYVYIFPMIWQCVLTDNIKSLTANHNVYATKMTWQHCDFILIDS